MRAHAFFSSSTLQLMKSRMSGWSALRMTILAARRVLPPDLPPPANSSRDERIADRLLPVPDPNLKSIPSVRANVRIESIVSCTELMKHAEHCGAFSNPQLNHTGLLNAAFWYTSRCFSSAENDSSASSLAKYFCSRAQCVIVSTTRPISCLTLRSRSGLPICPRKYFETTMFVACWDHDFGISTSRCSKTTFPFSLPITAERISHSTSSNGSTPDSVKYRGNSSPGAISALDSAVFRARADPSGVADAGIAAADCACCANAAASRAGPLSMVPPNDECTHPGGHPQPLAGTASRNAAYVVMLRSRRPEGVIRQWPGAGRSGLTSSSASDIMRPL